MSNGYLVAARADVAAAHEISDGFGLEVIDAASIGDPNTAASGLAAAANVGLLISSASASDAHYVAILRVLAQGLQRAQLIVIDADARAALEFLPESWPVMSLDDARARSAELTRRRDGVASSGPHHAAPIPTPPPQPEPAPPSPQPESEAPPPIDEPHPDGDEAPLAAAADTSNSTVTEDEHAPAAEEDETAAGAPPLNTPWTEPVPHNEEASTSDETAPPPWLHDDAVRNADGSLTLPGDEGPENAPIAASTETPHAPTHPPAQDLSAVNEGPSFGGAAGVPASTPAPSAPPQVQAPAPASVAAPPKTRGRAEAGSTTSTAPADAHAFAPKKLRRGTPELVQVIIHQPKDLKAVIKAAKNANPDTAVAPNALKIGDVAFGTSMGVALETRGVKCEGTMQRRPWRGEPIDFSFSVEADEDAKKAVFIARIFVGDAQIGTIAFTLPISGPSKKAASTGDAGRLKRHKRVFLSYSSQDRATIAAIATAYEAAGVPHFWDRASLKSGEEWSPRLRKEIDRADLFHLCWSKAAASSEWVEKETEHALTRRKRSNGKNPDITVQMLDGPPWAPHPRQLDAINFDDFVRAAIVGYARGDGST
ncbi:MAG: TIR domain-containing protein [Vitreimonas sp.]